MIFGMEDQRERNRDENVFYSDRGVAPPLPLRPAYRFFLMLDIFLPLMQSLCEHTLLFHLHINKRRAYI